MIGIILGIHILICAGLVISVLLQSGKGGGLAGTFGGGAGSDTIFGGRGAATFLSKATTVLGTAFMVTSLVLALLSAKSHSRQRSLLREAATPQATEEAAPQDQQQGTPFEEEPQGGESTPAETE